MSICNHPVRNHPVCNRQVSLKSIIAQLACVVLVTASLGRLQAEEGERVIIDATNAAGNGCNVEITPLYHSMHAVRIDLEGPLAQQLARAVLLYEVGEKSIVHASLAPQFISENQVRLTFNADPNAIPKMQVFFASNRDGQCYCTVELSSYFQHTPDFRVTSARLAKQFPLVKLRAMFGVTNACKVQNYSGFEKGSKAAASLYLVDDSVQQRRNPLVGIKVSVRGTYFDPPQRNDHSSYQLNRVGTMSYGRDIKGKKEEVIASELIFISSDNTWEVSLVTDLKASHIVSLNALAKELDDYLSGLPDVRHELNKMKERVEDFGIWIVPPKTSKYSKLHLRVGGQTRLAAGVVTVTEPQAMEIIEQLHCGGFFKFASYKTELLNSSKSKSSLLSPAGGMIAVEGPGSSIEFFNEDWSQRGARWLRTFRNKVEGGAADQLDALIAEWNDLNELNKLNRGR